jgi:hypothetical protein
LILLLMEQHPPPASATSPIKQVSQIKKTHPTCLLHNISTEPGFVNRIPQNR